MNLNPSQIVRLEAARLAVDFHKGRTVPSNNSMVVSTAEAIHKFLVGEQDSKEEAK